MSYKLSFWENIFSIVNDEMDKQVCILGFKFRFQNKKKLEQANIYKDLPIQNNKIVFYTVNGAYNCNPKYIAEEILKQRLSYDIVWIVDKYILKHLKNFPQSMRLVMKDSPEDYIECATAKIWVSHRRGVEYVKKGFFKRENQIYIQTWHGSLGIKKTGEASSTKNKEFIRNCKSDAAQFDYMISNGKYTTDFFRETFYNYGRILECGHPRNDIFFKNTTQVKEKVYNELHISANKKIVLYAPTFRTKNDISHYDIDFKRIIEAMKKKLNKDFIFVLRLHPKMVNLKYQVLAKYGKDAVVDATDYSDMQELLAAADVVITDYSSCIYDFMLTYKPGFIYAADVKKYDSERGLYYPLSSTPFPVAENNDEMVKNIENFDYEKYKNEVKEFLDGKGCIDDGHASERVVKLIKSIIETPDKVEETIEEIVKR